MTEELSLKNKEKVRAEVAELIRAALKAAKDEMGRGLSRPVSPATVLYGVGSDIDSLALIQLLIDLERRMADLYGPVVTLTDEKLMLGEDSPLRTVGNLTEYLTALATRPRP